MMYLRATALWVVLPLLALGFGCVEQTSAKISPKDGSNDVPVNAIIRVSYTGKAWLRDAAIKPENFSLQACKVGSSTDTNLAGETENGTDSKTEKEKSDDAENRSRSSEGAVSGQLFARYYDVNRKDKETGQIEKLKRMDILFLPIPTSYEDPPLQENTRYCFTAADVKDEEGNVALGGNTTFTTEESTKFQFGIPRKADWIQPENLSSQDPQLSTDELIVLKFDRPIHPSDIEYGTKVCKLAKVSSDEERKETSDRLLSRTCEEGESVSKQIYLVESLPETKDRLIAAFDTYAIGGTFRDGYHYALEVGAAEKGSSIEDIEPIPTVPREPDFAADHSLTKTNVKKLLAKQRPDAFRILLSGKQGRRRRR